MSSDANNFFVEVEPGVRLNERQFAAKCTDISNVLFYMASKGDLDAERRIRELYSALKQCRTLDGAPPSVQRVAEIHHLIYRLELLVVPATINSRGVLEDSIELNESYRSDYPELFQAAKRNWRPRCNLRSLAIRIYLEQLHEEGFDSIDRQTIARDFRNFKKWEAKQSEIRRKDARGDLMRPEPVPRLVPIYLTSGTWRNSHRASKQK